jgi:hypothetical protein
MGLKKIVCLAIVLIFVVSNGLFAQSTNNEQRIIGTWTVIISQNGPSVNSVFTFNSNGTVNIIDSGERTSCKYMVAGSKIVIEDFGPAMTIEFSSDGRAIIISYDAWETGIALRKN